MIIVETEEDRQLLVDAFIEAKVSIKTRRQNSIPLSKYEEELFSRLEVFLHDIPIRVKAKGKEK